MGPPHVIRKSKLRKPHGEIAWSKEPNSRASTRTSRSRKASAGPGQAKANMKSYSHHSRSPLSRSAKDRGTMARVANPYSEGEQSDMEDRDYTVVGDGEESLVGQKLTPWSPEPSNMSTKQVTLLPEGLRKAKQLIKV